MHTDVFREKGSFYELHGGRFKNQDLMMPEQEENYVKFLLSTANKHKVTEETPRIVLENLKNFAFISA